MKHGRAGIISGAVSAALWLSGCAAGPRETHAFPSTWPGSQPLDEDAPTVSVQPLQMAFAGRPQDAAAISAEDGLPTAAVLTALLIKHLHAGGVNAVLEQGMEPTAPFQVDCAVPTMRYTAQSGYPEQYRYEAGLTCTLMDAETRRVVWTRSLEQRYETAALVNTLSKLPEQPHRHDRILYRECIVPLWDAMAASVRTALVSRAPLPPDTPEAPAAPDGQAGSGSRL